MADLEDGESVEMKGSAAKPYTLTNTGGVYSCSCPAWRNQSLPIEQRTCKHLRRLRGDAAEEQRTAGALPQRARKAQSAKNVPPILLAQKWDNAQDLTDWWLSEKLDGVRAYWDGSQFLSRQGNVFHAPDWFVETLPDVPLDGELWLDRKAFQRTVSIVRRQDKSDHWKELRYVIFDAPGSAASFEDRIEFLKDTIGKKQKFASLLTQERCTGTDHLQSELARIESLGGEGLMLREPRSEYEIGRSMTLLKVKSFHDTEAIVTGHQAGRGRFKGKLGALEIQLPDGTELKVGTGFSDAERGQPPAVGSTIPFRYQELTDHGVPRFPSYVRLHSGQTTEYGTNSDRPSVKKKSVKRKATKKAASKTPETESEQRYFEYVDDRSSKFWEICVKDLVVTVRYGRIGSTGQTKDKEFDTAEKAQAHADKLIAKKPQPVTGKRNADPSSARLSY